MGSTSDSHWELPNADALSVASLLDAAAASRAERVASTPQMSFTGSSASTATQPMAKAHAIPPAPTPASSRSSAGDDATARPPEPRSGADQSLEAVVDAMIASGGDNPAAPASDDDDTIHGTGMRKRGRPQGSKNKPYTGPPRKRKGRSHDDDWQQGHHSLQPNVRMVCLAGIDKRTGAASKGCGMVLPPESVRWVTANSVKHVPDGVPCAVIWTHGGGCPGGGAFRPAHLRAGYAEADASGDISAWVAITAQEEQPHVGQTAGYRLHDGTDFNRDQNGEYKKRGKAKRADESEPEARADEAQPGAVAHSAAEATAQSEAHAQRARLAANERWAPALPPPAAALSAPSAAAAAAAAAAASAATAPATVVAPPHAPYLPHLAVPYAAPPLPAVAPAVMAVPLESVVPFPESQLPPPPHSHMSARCPPAEPNYGGFGQSLSQARLAASSSLGPPAVLPAPSALAAAAAAMAPAILPTGRALHTACADSRGGGYGAASRAAAAPAASAYTPWAEGELDAAELLVRAADLHALTEGYPEPEPINTTAGLGAITPGRYADQYI